MDSWKVLFVKPRCEKKVAEYCGFYNIPCYLPLREKRRIVQRRRILVKLPVFPGYVFANLKNNKRLLLLQTNCLVKILEPVSSFGLARVLVMVRRALAANPALCAEPQLKKGQPVRIVSGPFMGIEGKVVSLNGKNGLKVYINIEMIGQAVTVLAEAAELQPLPDPSPSVKTRNPAAPKQPPSARPSERGPKCRKHRT